MSFHTILMGGLGNQLFQTAVGYAHAKRHGLEFYVVPNTNYKEYFNTYLRRCRRSAGPISALWREPHFHYAPIPHAARSLYGYFQSSKYFNDVSAELQTLFDPPTDVKRSSHEKYGPLIEAKENTIVVHVRRGDYLNHPNFHVVCTELYYKRAVDAARAALPGCRLVVFSDDLEWCRSQPYFAATDTMFVDEADDVIALHTMSQFTHYIISNSTFSWWAVWFGDQKGYVWAPNKWFGPEGPQDWHDIYEPSWIQIQVD